MRKLLILLLVLFQTAPLHAQVTTNDQIDQKINALLTAFPENLNIGILVQDVDTGAIIYSKNADRYFIPASNQKLFTAFAALQYLNPNFTYQTRIFLDSTKLQNGVLYDNVYFQFTGDPTLTTAELNQLIQKLKDANLQQISGDIIIDDTAFDDIAMSPGTTWDDQNYCFGAPLNSIILDHNCVGLTLAPTEPKQPVKIITSDKQPQYMFFINEVITQETNAADCAIKVRRMNDTTYHVSGCMRAKEDPKTIWLAIANPRINIQQALLQLLKNNNINFIGTIRFKKITTPVKLFASEASPAMPVLINAMLKDSDNTIANAIFKTLGGFFSGSTGNWQNGSDAIRSILNQSIRLEIAKTTFIDGAGISRYNYLTPKQILTLLRNVYYSNISTWFISSLPVSGTDGTLKNRMKEDGLRGKVRAKTGSETGVTSLAGYLHTKNKRTLAFAILINGFVDSPTKYKVLEDKICATLIEHN